MKALLTVVLFVGLPFLSFSQKTRYNCYDNLIQEGKNMLKSNNKDKYKLAIQIFNSARRCDPSQSEQVDKEIDKVFDLILDLKKEADDNLRKANIAKQNEEKERKKA